MTGGCVTVVGGWVTTGGAVTIGAAVVGAGAGGVVSTVRPEDEPPEFELEYDDDPELDDDPDVDPDEDPDVTFGATCVLPSVSMVCFVAPATFCSVTAHCASTSLYT